LLIGQLRQEMTIGPVHIESLLEPRMADDTYGERLVDNALALLADRTTTAGTPWALGILACCHALLSEGSDAEPYQAALKAALSASARSGQCLDVPERADRELALLSAEPVRAGLGVVAVDQRVRDKAGAELIERGQELRIRGRMNLTGGITSTAASRTSPPSCCTNACRVDDLPRCMIRA
jgi:hypothetical protein